MDQIEKNRVFTMLAVGITALSFAGILIKLSTAPPLIIAFYRMALSSLILTPIFLLKYRKEFNYVWDYRMIIAGFLLAIHFFLWISAFEYTKVANAVIFVSLQPLFTLILEFFFAREDLRKGVVLGIVLALLGGIIISFGDSSRLFEQLRGDLLALAAAFFAGLYLFIGRGLRKEVQYFPYIYLVYGYCTVFLGILVLISGLPPVGYPPVNYLLFLGMAIGPTLLGHSSINYAVRYIPVTLVALLLLGEPILTTVLARIILGEKITVVTIVGGILILVGVYQAMNRKQRQLNN